MPLICFYDMMLKHGTTYVISGSHGGKNEVYRIFWDERFIGLMKEAAHTSETLVNFNVTTFQKTLNFMGQTYVTFYLQFSIIRGGLTGLLATNCDSSPSSNYNALQRICTCL
jgi:hypothetical protein